MKPYIIPTIKQGLLKKRYNNIPGSSVLQKMQHFKEPKPAVSTPAKIQLPRAKITEMAQKIIKDKSEPSFDPTQYKLDITV